MIQIVWVMQATPDHIKEFRNAYNPDGLWVQLFRRGEGYISTELLPDMEDENRFLVIDRELFQRSSMRTFFLMCRDRVWLTGLGYNVSVF